MSDPQTTDTPEQRRLMAKRLAFLASQVSQYAGELLDPEGDYELIISDAIENLEKSREMMVRDA